MNYKIVGERIRAIRETELRQTMEEFSEELGISTNTVSRLENATTCVSNIEIYDRISKLTGYTIDELISDKDSDKAKEKTIKKLNYLLNVITLEELELIYSTVKNLIQFYHKDEVRTLKDIKKDVKKK